MLSRDELMAVALVRMMRSLGGTVMEGMVVERKTVKGFEQFLSSEDIAFLLQKPVRYVREQLLVSKIIKATKAGGNSWRIVPDDFRRWIAAGCPTGSRFARPSGGPRAMRDA